MSISSRDYMRDSGPGGRTRPPSEWSVITWLLVINIGVYVVSLFVDTATSRPFENAFALSIEALQSFKIWTLFTYQFLHGSILHLLGNMLFLFFLGRVLLGLIHPRQFLQVYFVGVLVGGVAQILYNSVMDLSGPIMGASAGVSAIVFALVTLIPHQSFQLLLFFVVPINLTMRQLGIIMIVLQSLGFVFSLIQPPPPGGSIIAYFAHFGGMVLGWAYIKYYYPNAKTPLSGKPRSRSLKEKFGIRVIKNAKVSDPPPGDKAKPKEPFVSSDIDAILDKINAEGFQSLTEEEQRLLKKSSNRLSKRLDDRKK